MYNKRKFKLLYTPPTVMETQGVLLEQDLLIASTRFHFDTSYQDVENYDFSEGDDYFEGYNYKWE